MKKYIAIALMALSISSCQLVDVLDKKPEFEADLEGAITDPKSVELALNGVYSKLPSNGYNVIFPTMQGSFQAGTMLRQDSITSGNSINMMERYANILSYSSNFTDAEWDGDYQTIKNANFLIEAVNKIDEKKFAPGRKQEVIGEAHFLRAFANSRLIERYAEYWDLNSKYGLILRNESPNAGNVYKQRSTVAESYDAIFSDLDVAIANAPKYKASYQASAQAAKVQKAKMLFYSRQYDRALTLIKEVKAEVKLETTYAGIYDKHSSSPEVLFARVFGSKDAPNTSVRENAYKKGYWGPTKEFEAIAGDDPRTDVIYSHIPKLEYGGKVQYNIKSIKKAFNDKNDMPIMYMRTAEIYLMEAECLYRTGADFATAYAPIAELRNRAGAALSVPASVEEMEDAILNEWIIEISFENWHEWYAVQRFCDGDKLDFAKLLELNSSLRKRHEDEKDKEADLNRLKIRRINRIPPSETNTNPVEQNPGW
ncbi:MAG: RagB/SusD family nutrient uptake outer membrane protein [Bacteroidales bacterium]